MQNVTDTSVYDILSLFYGHVLDKDLDGSKSLKRYVESNNSEIKGEKNSRIMKKKLFWGH